MELGCQEQTHSETIGGANGKGSAQGKSVCSLLQPPAGAWNVPACFKVLEGYNQEGKKCSKRFANAGHGVNMTKGQR